MTSIPIVPRIFYAGEAVTDQAQEKKKMTCVVQSLIIQGIHTQIPSKNTRGWFPYSQLKVTHISIEN